MFSIFGLTHLNDNPGWNNEQNNVRAALQENNPSSGDIKILNHQLTKPFFGDWTVRGQVENTGASQLRYATIEVNFYDKNRNLLYFSSINLSNIAPGEIQDFEVIYRGPDVQPDSYEIALGPSL